MMVVDVATLDRSEHGSVTGVIFVKTGGTCFPDERWSDFPVVILGWWMDAAGRVLTNEARQESLSFMDGPFQLRLRYRQAQLLLEGEQRGGPVKLRVAVSAVEIARSLRDAANLVINECLRRGWQSRDLSALQRSAARFEPIPSRLVS